MADIHDVLVAQRAADDARRNAATYGGSIEDGRTESVALAVLLAAEAVAQEIRALAVRIDYLSHQVAKA